MNHKKHNYFKFLNWNLDTANHTLSLNYEIEKVGKVTEILSFPKFKMKNDKSSEAQIHSACELIHLICGVSYYKAGLANEIKFEYDKPSALKSCFYKKTWKHGLAELAFENKVSLDNFASINNQLSSAKKLKKATFTQPKKSLVAIGGGKDSLVTVEELLHQGNDVTLFMVGGSELIKQVAGFTQLPLIQVQRKIDPKLIKYNKTGDGFNGHIPITAINSCVGVLCALLFDFNEVVFSNERSADSANTQNEKGEPVNHQYSKSLEFEQDLSCVIEKEISTDICYYSQQRRFSELAILEKFSHYTQYFSVFSSCNRNFHIDGSQNNKTLWCCDCPKCRFVFLGLAPFVEKETLLKIFGHNLLNDSNQEHGFAELLGLKGFKPFECVGEIEESQLAFSLIKEKNDWRNDVLISTFKNKVLETSNAQKQYIMQPSRK